MTPTLQRRYMQLEGLQLLADDQPGRLATVGDWARVQSNQESRLVHSGPGRDLLGTLRSGDVTMIQRELPQKKNQSEESPPGERIPGGAWSAA